MKNIRQTLMKYSEESSLHGVKYIGWSFSTKIEKLIWFLIVGIGITISILSGLTAYYDWQDDPILTTVATTGLPIENIEYPAITICGQVKLCKYSNKK